MLLCLYQVSKGQDLELGRWYKTILDMPVHYKDDSGTERSRTAVKSTKYRYIQTIDDKVYKNKTNKSKCRRS